MSDDNIIEPMATTTRRSIQVLSMKMRIQDVSIDRPAVVAYFNAIPADTLTDFSQFPSPNLFTRATRMATRLRLSERMANLVISNVPGPRTPLYAAGATLLHYYPVSTIVDGQGLNITVQSYLNTLDFGLVSCRELVPDLWDLLDDILDDVVALGKVAGVDVVLPTE